MTEATEIGREGDTATIQQIKKRDGRTVEFNKDKITEAIWRAAKEVGGEDRILAEDVSSKVLVYLSRNFSEGRLPTVEDVQDAVEKILIEEGRAKTAKAYILYRQKRTELRRAKAILGVEDDLKLPLNAVMVLAARYLKRDENRRIIETPSQLFHRVAHAIAAVDSKYGASDDEVQNTENEFYQLLVDSQYMPNSPTLMNAGLDIGQLSACFVIPVGDSMEEIFDAVKYQALIHKTGGGTGFAFSRLRPKGDLVKSTSGVASGPVSFMKVFDAATAEIKQGGKRRGANMGILRVDHPDILDFIMLKEREGILTNFNISVAVTDKFMEAVQNNSDYDLINPRNHSQAGKLNARAVWNLIVTMAWKTGDPGVIFIDKINASESNPVPSIGPVESTNPCGEQPLYSYDSCNLGSINLAKMIKEDRGNIEVDWQKLRATVWKCVHFLDNVIDANKYPIPEIEEMSRRVRRIGLGVMGWADLLIEMNMPYNSNAALKLAESIMKFISDEGRKASEEIAKLRGSFPEFENSIWKKRGYTAMRNSTVTTIAPTGTISIIAGCSQGIEPLFAIAYKRNVSESLGYSLVEVNPLFEKRAMEGGYYSEELMQKIQKSWSIKHIDEIPETDKRAFVTSHDISPEWHVKMQSAFQKYTDNAVSKTINFAYEATPHDVEKAYLRAYETGCKGITIFRDQSRTNQVITTVEKQDNGNANNNLESPLSVSDDYNGGCETCSV